MACAGVEISTARLPNALKKLTGRVDILPHMPCWQAHLATLVVKVLSVFIALQSLAGGSVFCYVRLSRQSSQLCMLITPTGGNPDGFKGLRGLGCKAIRD